MTIKMIVAFNAQGVIGKDNKIPWFYKGDLKFFKDRTMGQVVIMGRKTWESLPPKMRPLPGRVNIVITSKSPSEIGMEYIGPTGVDTWSWTASNMSNALKCAEEFAPGKDVWLIGGQQVYREGLQYANECLITHVPDELESTEDCVLWPGFSSDWGMQSTHPHPECPELFVAVWTRMSSSE